jgi:hypothetical protein
MNMKVTMDDFVSKPKVNRSPFSSARSQGGEFNFDNYIVWRSLLAFVVAALLIVAFVGYKYGMVSSEVSTLSPDDMRLMALINSSGDVAKNSNSSIYFNDDEGVIVGQMVRVDSESKKTTPDNSAVIVTEPTKSDLLVILSKH